MTFQPGAVEPGAAASWSVRGLERLFAGLTVGRLTIVTPGGQRAVCGQGLPGAEATVVLHRWRTVRRLLVGGDIAFAEAYLDGDWSSPDIAALIELFASNFAARGGIRQKVAGAVLARLANRLRHAVRHNSRSGSRRNIMAHYDLGNEFYAHWLDRGMSYSSALYAEPDQTLEAAQTAKLDAVVAALGLRGGEHVLEIGCGWGGLAERLAREGCQVTGVTLSPAQLGYARIRMAQAGLSDRVELRLQDYRDIEGRFDRVVSVEMIEAVGRDYWPAFFASLRDRLRPGGRAVLQAITIDDARFDFYAQSPDFIQRYIFPGGMLPSVAAMRAQARAVQLGFEAGLCFGSSYARTLAEWRHRFLGAWSAIEGLGFDPTFKRMWEYYLAYCEGGFRSGMIDVGLFRLERAAPDACDA